MFSQQLTLLLIPLTLMLLISYLLRHLLGRVHMPSLLAPLIVGFAFQLIPFPQTFKGVVSGEAYGFLSQLGIIPVQIFYSAKLIDQRLFSAFIAVSTITTAIIPPLLSFIVNRWRESIA